MPNNKTNFNPFNKLNNKFEHLQKNLSNKLKRFLKSPNPSRKGRYILWRKFKKCNRKKHKHNKIKDHSKFNKHIKNLKKNRSKNKNKMLIRIKQMVEILFLFPLSPYIKWMITMRKRVWNRQNNPNKMSTLNQLKSSRNKLNKALMKHTKI